LHQEEKEERRRKSKKPKKTKNRHANLGFTHDIISLA